MTATALLAELHAAGIRLTASGDRLHLEAKPGVVTLVLRERLALHKAELLAAVRLEPRTHLVDVAGSALDRAAAMDAGKAPKGYTQAVHCEGCGPVLLWAGCPPVLKACPWCFRRRAGKPIARPGGAP